MVAHITPSMGSKQDDPKEKRRCSSQSKPWGAWLALLSDSRPTEGPSEGRHSICGDLIWVFWCFGALLRKCVTHPHLQSLATRSSGANEATLARGVCEKHFSPSSSLSPLCCSVIGGLLVSCLETGSAVTPSPHPSFPAPPPVRTAAAVVAFHLVAED